MTDRNEDQRILTILSWNVNGFNRKRSEVLHHLSLLKADVVFLQETHVGPDRIYSTGSIKVQDLECDYMAAFTVFKGSSRGVAILFKNNLGCGGFNVNCDEKGRFLIISCQIWGHDFVFINVYNSNDEKIKLTDFTQISTYIPHSAYLVVGGDFNTVMDADLDKTSNLRNRVTERLSMLSNVFWKTSACWMSGGVLTQKQKPLRILMGKVSRDWTTSFCKLII